MELEKRLSLIIHNYANSTSILSTKVRILTLKTAESVSSRPKSFRPKPSNNQFSNQFWQILKISVILVSEIFFSGSPRIVGVESMLLENALRFLTKEQTNRGFGHVRLFDGEAIWRFWAHYVFRYLPAQFGKGTKVGSREFSSSHF